MNKKQYNPRNIRPTMNILNLTSQELRLANGGSELSDAVMRWLGYNYERAKDVINEAYDDFIESQAVDVHRCKI
ncbi:MAG: hypothetical protein K9G70_13210 [Prolixibacteraceae bacterium]|nr:hypothetical protein [Prolixibacteraceae bacterium]